MEDVKRDKYVYKVERHMHKKEYSLPIVVQVVVNKVSRRT